MAVDSKKSGSDKPKRKRVLKSDLEEAKKQKEAASARAKKAEPEKKPTKRPQDDIEEEEILPISDRESTIPPAIAQMLQIGRAHV